MPKGVYPRKSVIERFWLKVNKDGPIPEHKPELGPCWVWIGRKNPDGYGMINVDCKIKLAHNISLILAGIEINYNLVRDHICKNTSCVNPSHIEQVTSKENTLRGSGPSAINARMKCCKYGHKFSIVRRKQSIRRMCKVCKARKARERYANMTIEEKQKYNNYIKEYRRKKRSKKDN